jgi:hypothetical protein
MTEQEPAFPSQPCGRDGMPVQEASPGMSLRDWLAGQALPQAITDYERVDGGNGNRVLPRAAKPIGTREDVIAWQAYRYADAMMSARDKKKPTTEE